jgi:hypothetical protein
MKTFQYQILTSAVRKAERSPLARLVVVPNVFFTSEIFSVNLASLDFAPMVAR